MGTVVIGDPSPSPMWTYSAQYSVAIGFGIWIQVDAWIRVRKWTITVKLIRSLL